MEEYHLSQVDRRLDAHGQEIDTIEKCLERLTVLCEQNNRTQADHEARLREIEGHSGTMWDNLVTSMLCAVAGGLIAYALAVFGLAG